MKRITLLLCSAALLSSCSVTESMKTSQRKLNRQAETNAMNTKVVNKPILADLEVGPKRELSTYKTTNKDIAGSMIMSGGSEGKKGGFLMSASEGMKNEAKNRAQFKFMEDFKCDYLVDPIYKIETESTSGSTTIYISVEVSAYPAF